MKQAQILSASRFFYRILIVVKNNVFEMLKNQIHHTIYYMVL